jgi:UDP-N-acetylmuramoyl-tripeptide--D-alanyl-D-alanine ligase
MKWTLDEVAAICRGTGGGHEVVDSVVIDSRLAGPGALFVAVTGERTDGHEYVDEALDAGAAGVVVARGRRGDRPGIEVEDTLAALLDLAIRRRSELDCPFVAITGSSGKTTTKDLIAAVLGGTVHASPRSYNNEFGVPLTVLGIPDGADAAVVEVGSRGIGHIAALAPAVRPDVAVITTIGRAHLEMFGSVPGVAAAKWELVEALGAGGIAVLPHGDPHLADRTAEHVITFGETPEADVAVSDVELDASGRASFVLTHGGVAQAVSAPVPGRHQPVNSAAAVAAAIAVGRDFADAAARIGDAAISPWRMELDEIVVDGGTATVVNDAYNANPDSMEAALETVAAMPGRRIAVLGKMYELGDHEVEEHRHVGVRAAELGFQVVVVGEDPGIGSGAGPGTLTAPDADTAAALLAELIRAGDVVLVKASRAAGLESIAGMIGGTA